MNLDKIINDAIQKAVARYQFKSASLGVAKNVNDDYCDVVREGSSTLTKVKLHVVEDSINSCITIKPKEGSSVIVALYENDNAQACIIQVSEIEEVLIKKGNAVLRVRDKIRIGNTEANTLKKVNDLIIDAVQAIIVLQGRNPDRVKLMQAKNMNAQILE